MILYIFNPENDLALADGGANYCPPPAAALIAHELASPAHQSLAHMRDSKK